MIDWEAEARHARRFTIVSALLFALMVALWAVFVALLASRSAS